MRQLRNPILLKKTVKRIKQLRAERQITQEDFYFDTGIHIGRIEGAHLNISLSTLKAICDYFKITLEEFFKGIA